MLDKPKYGWSHITIGDWSDRCSYVDDVPEILFDAIDKTVRTMLPSAAEFDAEGYTYIILFTPTVTYIVSEGRRSQLFEERIDIEDVAKAFADDIETNLQDWVEWDTYCSDLPNLDDYRQEREKDLAAMCRILRERIRK